MEVLLLGANGQVGHELRKTLTSLGNVVALARPDIDFLKPGSLRAAVRQHRPAVIVNAAAYTAVDKAETDAEHAFAVNAVAPGVLAEEAKAIGASLVHYSTDYVFDGSKPTSYVETDKTAPLSVYGRSKRDGELAMRACRKHLIFRTSWVFGAHGNNFIKTMLLLAKDRPSLRVVADQFGAPTSAALIAEITADVLHQMAHQSESNPRWGLYHLAAGGETTWYGLASYAIARAEAMALPLRATPSTITPITSADYPTPATRPANSRLATTKLQNAFALTPPDWQAGVEEVLARIIPEMRQ